MVLLYGTGNYIQYPVINHNGKEYFKNGVYVYITESLVYSRDWPKIVNQFSQFSCSVMSDSL